MLYTKNRKHRGSSKKKASFKYQYHPSITSIKDIMKSIDKVSTDKVKDIIKTLNTKKACPDGRKYTCEAYKNK